MEVLPNEVLIQILSFIHPVYENLSGYALVCAKWNDLLRHTASLWRHIHLEDDASVKPAMNSEYEKVLLSCLKRFGRFIHCIRSEEESFFVNSKLRRLLPSLPNLRCLDVPVLAWTRIFAQSFRSAANLRSLTIDDHRSHMHQSHKDVNKSKLSARGLRLWDLKVLSRHFPKLETLSLNICYYKLYRSELLPILDALRLKELRLECVPYGMNLLAVRNIKSPIKGLVNSRHASIVTYLELSSLPVSMNELAHFMQNLTNLRHLATGVCDNQDRQLASTPVLLESRSLAVFVLRGMTSVPNVKLKCIMPNLEVILIKKCDCLESFEVHAKTFLQFSVTENCNLKNLSATCQRIEEVEVQDCPALELQNFRDFVSSIPTVRRIEISQDWQTLELDRSCCPELRKLVLRDVSIPLSVIKVDCPTLLVFKCTGDFNPEKGKLNPEFAGCEFSICADNLKKVQINDVSNAKRISIKCQSVHLIQIGGMQPWQTPAQFVFRAAQRIDIISLKGMSLSSLQVFAPSVTHMLIEECCLAPGSDACKFLFRCDVIDAMRLIRCDRMRKFSLGVPSVTTLTVDSCARLRDVNLEGARVNRIRISNCPLLKSRNESFLYGLFHDSCKNSL